MGKTQLVKKWREGLLRRENHGGAMRAYDWSFYSQGTQQQASADEFFDRALRWFGETEMEKYKDPWLKGERLAQLVSGQRNLLILDGLEPLQHPPGPLEGELSDPSLQSLLRGLAEVNPGLCVVTTRETVPDLAEISEPRRVTIDLRTLEPADGAELLKQYGVHGTDEDLQQASRDYDGHALALILLGTYLRDRFGGDIVQRNRVTWPPGMDEDSLPALDTAKLSKAESRFAKHARKVMASYVNWFENEAKGDDLSDEDPVIARAAVAILRLMGLFNRPADAGCLNALREPPPIPSLTDALFKPRRAKGSAGAGHAQEPPGPAPMQESPGSTPVRESPGSKPVQETPGSARTPESSDAHRTEVSPEPHLTEVCPGPHSTEVSIGPQGPNDSLAEMGSETFERDDELWTQAVLRLRAARLLADDYSAVPEGRPVLAPGGSLGKGATQETPSPSGATQENGVTPPGFGDESDAHTPGLHPGLKPIAAPRLHESHRAGDGSLDAHPLVREHFAAQLDKDHPDAAREAHCRLYEHLKQAAPELPDNLNDMMPLYHAVAHGCKAGLHQEALDHVYWKRIQRQHEFYSYRLLGSFGADLAAISALFDRLWDTPAAGLLLHTQGFVLSLASSGLRALGRLAETALLVAAALLNSIQRADWTNAAVDANALSELSLTLGDVSAAVRQGEQSVELADRSGDAFQRMATRATLAYAMHASAGDLPRSRNHRAALAAFREAEAMQQQRQPDYPLLYSLIGYRYCDLMMEELSSVSLQPSAESDIGLTLSRISEIRDRAESMFQWRLENDALLDTALDNLTMGRTYVLETRYKRLKTRKKEQLKDDEQATIAPAEKYLNDGVSVLRQAGMHEFLSGGLLHRATLWRVKYEITNDNSQIQLAERDLDEAERIAERGSMLIWQIDAALERAQLAFALKNRDETQKKLDETRELIKQTEKPYVPHVPDWEDWDPPSYIGVFKEGDIVGYHRRNPEIEALQQAIDRMS